MHFNSRPAVDRLAQKVALDDNGCLVWIAYIERSGYSRLWIDGKNVMAHRWSYEHHVGPIPDGLHLDHLCRVRHCVNPEHLEPVTPAENVRRGIGPEMASARGSVVTHCPNGHEYDEENTYHNGHGRSCWTCKREGRRRHYEANKKEYIERAAAWREANLEKARKSARESQARYRAKKKVA